jgi:hypothetical protein
MPPAFAALLLAVLIFGALLGLFFVEPAESRHLHYENLRDGASPLTLTVAEVRPGSGPVVARPETGMLFLTGFAPEVICSA